MSYILDALKKMEHEKTIKSSNPGMVTISGELFRDPKPRPSAITLWKILSITVAVAVIASGATWALLRDNKSKPDITRQIPPDMVSSAPKPPVQVSPDQKAGIVITPAAMPPVTASSPVVPGPAKPETTKATKATPPPKASFQSVAAPADIKISGIAWQEERKARRAVVNGFLVQEGSVVSGARISEIFYDRVRFSTSGGYFELPMVASGQPVPK